MATVAAADLYPDSPEGKIKLVMDHNEVGNVGIGAPDDRADCPAAVVHVRLRLGQNDFLAVNPYPADKCAEFFLADIHPQTFGAFINSHETCIVPRVFVLFARVAEPDDDFQWSPLRQEPEAPIYNATSRLRPALTSLAPGDYER